MKRPTCILIWIWLRKVHWPNEWIAPPLHCKHTYTGWLEYLFQSTPHLHPKEKIYQTNAQRSVDPCSSVGGNGPRCLLGGSASWVHCDADHSGPGGLQHYVTSESSFGPWFLTPFVRYKEHLWSWLLSANTFEWVFRDFSIVEPLCVPVQCQALTSLPVLVPRSISPTWIRQVCLGSGTTLVQPRAESVFI